MITAGIIIYVIGYFMTYIMLTELQAKWQPTWIDVVKNKVKVIGLSLVWVVILPIMIFGIFNFKK
jgi:hypothetical protein